MVVRFGGFNLLMSFMGCIGGLKALLMTIYADHRSGQKAEWSMYSRAIQAHILTNLILAGIILDEVDLTEEENAKT
jgi:hypothetical protein